MNLTTGLWAMGKSKYRAGLLWRAGRKRIRPGSHWWWDPGANRQRPNHRHQEQL